MIWIKRSSTNDAEKDKLSHDNASSTLVEALEPRQLLSGTLAAVVSSSTLPAAVVAGQSVSGSAVVTIVNQTDATPVSGSAEVEVFASNDGVVDNSSALLVSKLQKVNLKPGFAAVLHLKIKSFPTNLPTGFYTLLAEVSDPFGNSSSSTYGPNVTIESPVVSLQNVVVGPTSPKKIQAGKAANVAITVSNLGNITSTGPIAINLFLYTEGQIQSSPVATISPTAAIKTGHKHVFHVHFVIPQNQATGTYALSAILSQDDSNASGLEGSTFSIE